MLAEPYFIFRDIAVKEIGKEEGERRKGIDIYFDMMDADHESVHDGKLSQEELEKGFAGLKYVHLMILKVAYVLINNYFSCHPGSNVRTLASSSKQSTLTN